LLNADPTWSSVWSRKTTVVSQRCYDFLELVTL
jgi:hypothetical protein